MPDTTCISRLDACNIGLPYKLGLQEADFFRLLLEKCPDLKLVESEGHTFDGPPQFNEILSRMELIRTPGEVHDQIELLDISQLVLDHPLVATDFKRLTGLSLQQLQKLRSFNLNSLNHSFHSLPGNLGGIEGGIVLVKVLDAMSSIEHLSFNASRLGVAWTLGVGQVLIESLRSESGIGRERPDGSQLTIPRLQLTSLKSIDLSECGLHADAGSMLAELLQALPGLRGLSLARNYRLENAADLHLHFSRYLFTRTIIFILPGMMILINSIPFLFLGVQLGWVEPRLACKLLPTDSEKKHVDIHWSKLI